MPRFHLALRSTAISALGVLLAFLCLILLHMHLEELAPMDRTVQTAIHGWTSPVVTRGMQGLSIIGSTRFFLPVLGVGLLLLRRSGHITRRSCLSFVYAIAGAILLNEVFKARFHRLRPSDAWAIGHETTFSFPSGHALFAFVLYGFILYLAARRQPLLLIPLPLLVLAIGVSRVYLGVHWPSDVVAGYAVGACWLTAAILVDQLWRAHPPSPLA